MAGGARSRLVVWGGFAGGLILAVIGVRFLLVPASAQRFFGITREMASFDLHYVIGLRDIWLGLAAMLAAHLRDQRALLAWFALAAVVCVGDAAIVSAAGGPGSARAFHIVCAILSAALAVLAYREVRSG